MRLPATAIRTWREAVGLTQAELGQRLGVVAGTVAHWEADRAEPRPKTRRKLEALISGQEPVPEKAPSMRYSAETRQEMIAALEMILDRAPSPVVEKVSELLTRYAGQYRAPSDRPPAGAQKKAIRR